MRRYWAYQLAGWLGYSAVGIAINMIGGGSLGPLLLSHVVLVSGGIALTHQRIYSGARFTAADRQTGRSAACGGF
jgi:hypothetical protein